MKRDNNKKNSPLPRVQLRNRADHLLFRLTRRIRLEVEITKRSARRDGHLFHVSRDKYITYSRIQGGGGGVHGVQGSGLSSRVSRVIRRRRMHVHGGRGCMSRVRFPESTAGVHGRTIDGGAHGVQGFEFSSGVSCEIRRTRVCTRR